MYFHKYFQNQNLFRFRTRTYQAQPEAAERMVTMVICPSPKFKHSWHYLLVSSLVCSDL